MKSIISPNDHVNIFVIDSDIKSLIIGDISAIILSVIASLWSIAVNMRKENPLEAMMKGEI